MSSVEKLFADNDEPQRSPVPAPPGQLTGQPLEPELIIPGEAGDDFQPPAPPPDVLSVDDDGVIDGMMAASAAASSPLESGGKPKAKPKPKPRKKPRPAKHVSDQQMEMALRVNHGNIAATAQALGVMRKVVYERVNMSMALQHVARECRDVAVDVAEAQLFKGVNGGHPWAVMFMLRTWGRDRGFGPAQQTQTINITKNELRLMTDDQLRQFIASCERGQPALPAAG